MVDNPIPGTDSTISWSDNFDSAVKIELYRGEELVSIISDRTESDGSYEYDWQYLVDGQIEEIAYDTDYQIKISQADDSSVYDLSDEYFTIGKPEIELTSLNDGDRIELGELLNITWSDNIDEDVSIDLYRGDAFVETIVPNIKSDGQTYWNVPTNLPLGDKYQLKVSKADNDSVYDLSDGYFSIYQPEISLTSFNNGEKIEPGETVNITWSDNIDENVKIDLFVSSDTASVQSIESSTPSDGSYEWTVPEDLPVDAEFKLTVSSFSNPAVTDTSDEYFSIEQNLVPIPDPSDFVEKGFDVAQGLNWNIKGNGDFNGDKIDDIIWQKQADGETHLWLLNQNGERQSHVNLGSNPGWNIKGNGDFNGDKIDDIIWQKQADGETHLWLLNQSGERQSHVNLGFNSGWNIIDTGDFDENGTTDILWQRDSNGVTHAWLLNNEGKYLRSIDFGRVSSDWNIRETGDFNGDGTADVLWQHNDGQVHTWLLKDGKIDENSGGSGGGGDLINVEAENFFDWAVGKVGIERLDTTNYRGQCVSLIARYLQDVYNVGYSAIGHGKDVAANVATQFDENFEPLTNQGLPTRGAVISFPDLAYPYGHVGIVMDSRTVNDQRQIKLMDSNSDSLHENSTVKIHDHWINIPDARANNYGNNIVWTNPKSLDNSIVGSSLIASGNISPGHLLETIDIDKGLKNLTVGAFDAGKNMNAVLAAIRAHENNGKYGSNLGNVEGDHGASTSRGAYQERFASTYLPLGNELLGTNYSLDQFHSGNPFAQDIAAIGRIKGYSLFDLINNANLNDSQQRFNIAEGVVNAWGSWFSDAGVNNSTPQEKYDYKSSHSQAIFEALEWA